MAGAEEVLEGLLARCEADWKWRLAVRAWGSGWQARKSGWGIICGGGRGDDPVGGGSEVAHDLVGSYLTEGVQVEVRDEFWAVLPVAIA